MHNSVTTEVIIAIFVLFCFKDFTAKYYGKKCHI